MLDKIYKTVQAELNEAQLGGLKPLNFNLFANTAVIKVVGDILLSIKTNVRKQNWNLDGQDLADITDNSKQVIEYFLTPYTITPTEVGAELHYILPEDNEFVKNVIVNGFLAEKLSFREYTLLQRNNYAKPSTCTPKTTKISDYLLVAPLLPINIQIIYIRKVKAPNWTFTEYQGKPVFNGTAGDFQDIDLPNTVYVFDRLVALIVEYASVYLRDFQVHQTAGEEQAQDAQIENRQ